MKNGFTLVELLAVIVILAVIALIATPIVLSIINDTKESAVIRSAEMYVSALENAILSKNLSSIRVFMPKECIVNTDGNVTCDGTPLEIEVNGDKPDSGLITYDRGRVTGIELTFGERKVITDVNGELVLESTLQEELVGSDSICKLISGEANEIGSKYECEVKSGTKYNFYVLSHEVDGTTNLIMERNICEDGSLATEDNLCFVEWISEADYLSAGGENWGNGIDENNYGPKTAMNFLNNATSDWNNIENLDMLYEDESGNFSAFAITGKARLPYYIEIDNTWCEYGEMYSCQLWTIDYLNVSGPGEEETYQENFVNGMLGYWMLSSHGNDSNSAYYVDASGYFYGNGVDTNDSYGIRPVINIKL